MVVIWLMPEGHLVVQTVSTGRPFQAGEWIIQRLRHDHTLCLEVFEKVDVTEVQ